MTGKAHVIELKKLSKIYNQGSIGEVRAIDKVDLQIKYGEFIDIVGVSGSGKSTLLNIIGLMDKSTKGELFIDSISTNYLFKDDLSEIRNRKIGFVFQDMYLIPTLSAFENVLLPKLPYGITKEEKHNALNIMKRLGLKGRSHHKPSQLSGGQRQRVAICRALINNPEILLADEPTGNLDSKMGTEILELLANINEKFGTTVIVATHDPKVQKYSRRTLEIEDGKIIRDEWKDD